MSDHSNWHTSIHLVLPRSSGAAVLMVPEGDGWALPCMVADDYYWWRSAELVDQALGRALGHRLLSLRCLSSVDNPSEHLASRVYVVEDADTGFCPEGGVWIDAGSLGDLTLAIPEHRTMIERFYNWPLASVLRAHTTTGDLYLKATSRIPLLADESALTVCLAALFPGRVPEPIAVDLERGWMLLPDVGPWIYGTPEDVKLAALQGFAQLQLDSVEQADHLLRAGCPDRRLEAIEAQLSQLGEMEMALSGLNAAELERLRAALPQFREICHALNEYRVPDTLAHGDLFGANIARRDGQFVYFDWGQACVSHPFLDAVHFLGEEEILADHARDGYLSHWTCFEPMERLVRAWELARPLDLLLEGMLRYHINTERGPEPEEQLGSVAGNLRAALRWIEQASLPCSPRLY